MAETPDVAQEFLVRVEVSESDGVPRVSVAADDELRKHAPELFAEMALAAALGLIRAAAISSAKGTEGFIEHAEDQVRGVLRSRITDIRFEE